MNNGMIADMVESILTDDEIITDKVKSKIKKALERNYILTSCYSLQVAQVQDVLGRDSKTSGWYIILEGARTSYKFFVNNDLEITRKPNGNVCRVVHKYDLYNYNTFYEGFWRDHF